MSRPSWRRRHDLHHQANPRAILRSRRTRRPDQARLRGRDRRICAGCGRLVTAAIIQAFWDLSISPYKVAKLSGSGARRGRPPTCEAHGLNGVHGRMPALVTGANAANRDLIYIGISGDGDSRRSASGSCATPSAAT